MQKSVAFEYTDNTMADKELVRSVPFTVATKKFKCHGINLIKEVKDLFKENYKTLNE